MRILEEHRRCGRHAGLDSKGQGHTHSLKAVRMACIPCVEDLAIQLGKPKHDSGPGMRLRASRLSQRSTVLHTHPTLHLEARWGLVAGGMCGESRSQLGTGHGILVEEGVKVWMGRWTQRMTRWQIGSGRLDLRL